MSEPTCCRKGYHLLLARRNAEQLLQTIHKKDDILPLARKQVSCWDAWYNHMSICTQPQQPLSMQFEIVNIDGELNIKWTGVETCGVSRGHFVHWAKRSNDTIVTSANVIESKSKNPVFTANSIACLLDECDIRLHDISLDVYKELQEVRSLVIDTSAKVKLLCCKMFM